MSQCDYSPQKNNAATLTSLHFFLKVINLSIPYYKSSSLNFSSLLNKDSKPAADENDLNKLHKFLDQEQNKLIDKVINNHSLFLTMMGKI